MSSKDRIITLITSIFLVTSCTVWIIKGAERTFDLTASLTQPTGNNSSPCPSGMVLVESGRGDFCVDKYENSPGTDCPYQDPKNQTETEINIDDQECLPVSKEGAVPWRNVTQDQARNLCIKAGKRLPLPGEWFQASLRTPDPGSGWGPEDCQVDSNWESQPGPTGFGKACVSAAGAYDMIGNVWEWVDETVFDARYDDRLLPDQGFVQGVNEEGLAYETDPEEPHSSFEGDFFWLRRKDTRGLARGGYWDNGFRAGVYSIYAVVPPSFSGVGVGFRCVK